MKYFINRRKPFSWMFQQSHPPAPPASQFWWKQSLHLSHLLTVVFWRKLGFYSLCVGPPFPIYPHLCLLFLPALFSFLCFRPADRHYGLCNNYPLFKMLGTQSVSDLGVLYALHNFRAQSCTTSWCFCYLCHCCNKIHNRKQLARFISFLLFLILLGEVKSMVTQTHGDGRARRVTSHWHSRRREGNAGTHNALFSLSVCSVWEHRPWDGVTHTRGGSSLDRHAEKCLS